MMINICLILTILSIIVEIIDFLLFDSINEPFIIIFILSTCYIYSYKSKEDRRRVFYKDIYKLLEKIENDSLSLGIPLLLAWLVLWLKDDDNSLEKIGFFFFGAPAIVIITSFILVILTKNTKKVIAIKEEAKKIIENEKEEEVQKAAKAEEDRKEWKVKQIKKDNLLFFKRYQNEVITITNRIRSLNPNATDSQKGVLVDNYTEEVLNWYYGIDQLNYSKADYDKSCETIVQSEIHKKRDFVRILFKLVVCDDGIKNDEWYALQNLMVKLKLNTSSINYLNRIYEPLRTEHDYYEQQQEYKPQSTYQPNLSSFYSVLGLTDSATKAEVQDAYHKLALLYHPDLPKNANRRAECETMMAKINEAYEKIGTR